MQGRVTQKEAQLSSGGVVYQRLYGPADMIRNELVTEGEERLS